MNLGELFQQALQPVKEAIQPAAELFRSESADAARRTLADLEARRAELTQALAAAAATLAEHALDDELGDAAAAAAMDQADADAARIRPRLERLQHACSTARRRLDAAIAREEEAARAARAAQLRALLAARLKLAAEAQRQMDALADTLDAMAENAADVAGLLPRGATTFGWPLHHTEVIARISRYAGGLGLLTWFDNRHLSPAVNELMDIPEALRRAQTPALTDDEAAAHAGLAEPEQVEEEAAAA